MSTVASDSLLKLLVEVSRAFESELNHHLRAELGDGLRPAHYAVFRHLDPAGTRITTLAQAAGITQQAMGELVTHLEDAGLVERRPDPSDRRARLVVATVTGRSALVAAADQIARIEGRLHGDLGDAGVADLRRLLSEARTALCGG